jgi:phosphomevalonate kinase
MVQGHTFSMKDLRHFNLFKSSDAALIYAPLLESVLSSFNHNVSLIIHYNQALQDIDDDLDDVQEDLRDQMPNIFILAALDRGDSHDYSEFHRHRLNISTKLILGSSAGSVLSLVDEYAAMVEGISVPEQFYFLKYLSRHYARTIRKKLAASRIDL